MKIFPGTKSGWWSAGLIAALPALFFIGGRAVKFYEGVPSGDTIPQDVMLRPGIALPMLAGFACGIAAFVVGMTSLIKIKDRAVLVFISTLLGFLVIVYIFAEMAFPH